jgi:hypothetical protein
MLALQYLGGNLSTPCADIERESWTRTALSQPCVNFEGWYNETAVAYLTYYQDLSGEYSDEVLLISPDTSWTIQAVGWIETIRQQLGLPDDRFPEYGICVSDWDTINSGTAAFVLLIDVSDDDVNEMNRACLDFIDFLETGPPEVPVKMSLIRVSDQSSVWRSSRNLTWFGGECAPIFQLPVLELAVMSPDSSYLFFSIFYGPELEHFMAELPPGGCCGPVTCFP